MTTIPNKTVKEMVIGNIDAKYPGEKKIIKEGPTGKSITHYVVRTKESIVKYFIEGGWNEYDMMLSFNQFAKRYCGKKLSGPRIKEGRKTGKGFSFSTEDLEKLGMKKLKFSEEEIYVLLEKYKKYRNIWDKFEIYSKGKTSTESNPKIQLLYSLYKRYLQPEISSESTTKSSKVINGAKTALCNVLQPSFKLAIGRKYKSKVNERISNGKEVVEKCNIDINRKKINKTLDKLLSKVKRFDFEYNFGRLWTDHVFSDGENYRFVDFDNVSYQIKGTELIGVMRDNLLISAGNYDSYESWKSKYEEWYDELLKMYEDKDLVKLLLFVKLVGTVFEDYGNLIYKREVGGKNKNFDEIKKGVEWNYRALEKIMNEVDK